VNLLSAVLRRDAIKEALIIYNEFSQKETAGKEEGGQTSKKLFDFSFSGD
jgi:hypothetical protein